MKNFISFFMSLTLLFLYGCSAENTVTVKDFSPKGGVANLTTFTIEFSENLAPLDKQNKWLSDQYVIFEPKIEGKFKWLSGNTLIFSPDYPLEPIQSYKAKITDKVLFRSKMSTDFEEYEFHTPDFDAFKAEFFWSQIPNQNYKISIKGNLYFNYPVDPAKLKKYLEVKKDDESKTDYQIMSESPSDVIAINFGEISQTKKEQELSVTIKEGLMSVVGKKGLADDKKFEQDLPPITDLAITSVASGFDGTNSWILVYTTQTVDDKRLKDFISIKPEKPLNYFVNENSFRIEGNFYDVQSAELKVKKGLPGLYGGLLDFDYEQEVVFVNLDPSINFTDKGGLYLMRTGLKNLDVNAVNIPEAEIEVSQIFKNNILHFLNQNTGYNYHYDYEGDYYSYNREYYPGNYGKELYSEKIKLTDRKNWLQNFSLNLDKALKTKYKGLFIVNVRSAKDRWRTDAKIISLSDLAVITKSGSDQITVFVNSISGAEPVPDVQINIISTNNQSILSGTTNTEGVIEFTDVRSKTEGFSPRLITAEKDDDFNYIDLNQTMIETSRFDVGGIYEYSPDYNTYIYSERNLYRPGDKVNLSGIVRDKTVKIVKEIPVIVKIITPTGKTFGEFKKSLNDQGSFELTFELPDYAQTGEYIAEVYSGSNNLLGSYRFSVEEFVPDKIRVMLKGNKKDAYPGDVLSVDINAEFLFGAKASGLKYEGAFQYSHRSYYSENYPQYDFSRSSADNTALKNVFRDGTLNQEGSAAVIDTLPEELSSKGIIVGNTHVSVFDLTGRTVNRFETFKIYPQNYFIGIKAPGYYFSTNENLKFKIIAVNEKDKIIGNLKGKAVLVRYEWQTVLKKDNNGRYYYDSGEKEIKEWEKPVDLSGGPKDLSFTVSNSGRYQLRISKEGKNEYVFDDFYAWGWGSSTASSFEVNREGLVEIVADKKSYEPGDDAKILFTTPFSGRMLLTIERNGIYSYRYVDVKTKSTEVEFKMTEDYMPNVYITATLFKKHTIDNSSPFMVGHGFASIKVEKKANQLAVKIIAPQKIKPLTRQEVTIKTNSESNIYVTLAAVDEGILQIKDYKTPDPYSYMYGKRPLAVDSHDLYKLLLPEIVTLKSPGGDSYEEESREIRTRTNPIATKRFKLLALWSGIRKTSGDGTVKVNLDIPQFNGDIRLMALAYSGSRFGSGEEHIKVSDDIIIEPEIPRFLAVNDSLASTVTLINTTSSNASVKVGLKVEGSLSVTTAKMQSVTIKPNSTQQVRFGIRTGNEAGAGKITFETSGFAKVREQIDISVRPISPLLVESGSGNIKAGQTLEVKVPSDYLKGTQNTTLTISRFPAIKFAKHLKYLVGYPHGCIEQTVSKLFPQLYFEDLAKLAAPDLYRTNNPVYYVKEGIKKLESMQLHNGSMAYWQGGDYTSWWGSVYAAHFLVEAKKAGFAVSESMLSKLLSYILNESRNDKTYDYVSWENNKRIVTKVAMKEIIYGLYVLALAGQGDISTMNYYKARPHLLTNDMKYMLAGSYALMNNWNTYNEFIPSMYKPEKTIRETGGCFDSEIRANAIMLNVLLEVEPANPQIPYMIKHITGMMDQMYSTQERSFAFLALGKAASITANTEMKVEITAAGKKLQGYNNKDITLSDTELSKGKIILKSGGKGEVYYFWSTEGIKLNAKVKEEDSFMKIRRSYYDYRTGAQLTNNFSQGRLIICKISLTGLDKSAENIVITDLLPACFEIENPRLSASAELQWKSKNPMNVQYMDIRDDRLLLFTDLANNRTEEFFYMLRVVSKGKFQLPVIGGDAMYDPEFHSYNGAGVITVKE